MSHLKRCFICLLILSASAQVYAQSKPYAPKPGSIERKAILNALRAPVEKELNRSVVFKVDHLKAKDGWAFLRGVPQQTNGKAIDYRGTPYQQAIDEGIFDDWICALLTKEGERWRVVVYVIGATDVAYEGWDEEFKAPKDIFK